MEAHSIRYFVEHRMLPEYFFQDREKIINWLLDDKQAVYTLMDKVFEKEGVANPYKKEQFDVNAGKLNNDIFLIKITFPKPEDEPLCYCSYVMFDMQLENLKYYCIEKGNAHGECQPFVCSWNEQKEHSNYGNCSLEKDEDLNRCIELYMQEVAS